MALRAVEDAREAEVAFVTIGVLCDELPKRLLCFGVLSLDESPIAAALQFKGIHWCLFALCLKEPMVDGSSQ